MKKLIIGLISVINFSCGQFENCSGSTCSQKADYKHSGVLRSLPNYKPVEGVDVVIRTGSNECIDEPIPEFHNLKSDNEGRYNISGTTIACPKPANASVEEIKQNKFNTYWMDAYPWDDETDVLLYNQRKVKFNFVDSDPLTKDTLDFTIHYNLRISGPNDTPLNIGPNKITKGLPSAEAELDVPEQLDIYVRFSTNYKKRTFDTIYISPNSTFTGKTYYFDRN